VSHRDTDTRPTGSDNNQDDDKGKNNKSDENHNDEGDEGNKGGGNEDNEGSDNNFATAPPPSPSLCPHHITASPPPS